MSIAVIKTGGKQYKVQAGDLVKIEKIVSKDKTVEFSDILGNHKVKASIVSEGKQKKVRILKFRPKKRYRRVRGHRQSFTQIKIESIK